MSNGQNLDSFDQIKPPRNGNLLGKGQEAEHIE